ncbi:zinc finger protein 665 isoform X2 [Bactrocera dorsalis]|uniref:Zinc finger protein 665 isoform X2 n=1 Tax=Bactrocera dorsalis TaxID=27457 RepID=A0ABM3JEV7_BACDO|nr:zinc finger protein 665 isoform X2 [Bactrocera dorsalis]
MFNETSCLLCLESSKDQIDLDCKEDIGLNGREVIELHFKEMLDIISQIEIKFICRICWDYVQTFHIFYENVKEVHKEAANSLKSVTLEEEILEIKEEILEVKEELIHIVDAQVEPRRHRGRPKRQRGPETVEVPCESSIPLKECQVKIEELILLASASISRTDICNPSEIFSEVLEVKDDILLKEYVENSISAYSSEAEEIESDNEDRHSKRVSRKINKTEGVNKKTAESDEYIAKKNFKFTCCICQTSLKNFKHLKSHFREVHQTRGYVLCCGKKLPERGLLIDHIHLHEDPDYFKCKHCGKRMTERRSLDLHLQYKHASCLKQHYKIKDTENQKSIPCLECDKTFSYDIELRKHMRLTHLKVYAKICDICGVSVKGCDALKRHQAVHTGKMRKLIKCDLCDATLTTKYGLARHMKTMHTEEYQTPQVCPMCSKVSPSVQAHRKHVRYMHSLQKKHVCNLCDKAFKRHTDFKDHMATHTGEALYTCSFCPQTFKSKANMYSHRKKKHPKEWAEQCELKKSVGVLLNQRGAETVKVFCETSIPFKECQVKIEELILPASMSPKDICNQSEIVSEVLEVKDESLLVKCMDDSMSTFSSDYEESESENEEDKQTKRKSRKINKRKGVNKKTAELDEYIAKRNFKFTCCICQTSLENFKHLNSHFREVHQTRGYVLCCGKKLTERALLIDHILLHEDPDLFKCKHCGMTMTKRRSLDLHLRYKHASCLKQHYKIKDTENQKSIPCLECDKTFSYDIELRKHMRLTHLKVYAKICDICGVSVKGYDALKRHQAVHTGKMRKLIKCDLCDSTLTTKYGLARHIKTMHTEEYQTPQVCPMCSKVSPSVMAHRKHIRNVHSLEKKHLCNLCDKAFKRHADFKEHMATHTGEALYTCSFCPQTFKSKANMYSHRKKKHSKEWAEQCELKKSVGVLLSQTVTTD